VAQLRESYAETVGALRRTFEQLSAAAAQFEPALDEQVLVSSWDSDDPTERNRVGLLLACCEKTYMLLMDLVVLSVKLGRRLGALNEDEDAPPLEVLCDLGVITHEAQAAIEQQRKVRNTSQHIYVELSMSELRVAALGQLGTTPAAIRNIAAWVESLESAPT
jgi:hypothetical protein